VLAIERVDLTATVEREDQLPDNSNTRPCGRVPLSMSVFGIF
jgi:hypothetical protein